MSQDKRERAFDEFCIGNIYIFFATEVACCGLDMSDIQLVVNYEMSSTFQTYLHRVRRTELTGTAITLLLDKDTELIFVIEATKQFSAAV